MRSKADDNLIGINSGVANSNAFPRIVTNWFTFESGEDFRVVNCLFSVLFSHISEQNNDYSDTLDFRRGGGGVGHVFRFGGP